MRVLLLLALVAVSQASIPAAIARTQALVAEVTSRVQTLHKIARYETLDDSTGFNSFCDGSLEESIGGELPAGVLDPLFSCFGPVCDLTSPTGPCPTLAYAFSDGGCATATYANVSANCANGCFGRIPGVFNNVFGCVVNQIPAIIDALAAAACAMVPPGDAYNQCIAAIKASVPPDAFSGTFDGLTDSIEAPLARLCLQNPASGAYCFGAFATGTASLANPTVTNSANCAYFASLGCCLSGLKVMIGDFNNTCANRLVTNAQLDTILATCSVAGGAVTASNPAIGSVPSCPIKGVSVKISKSSFALTGLLIAGINALSATDKFLLYRALQLDLAAAVGLTITQTIYLNIGTVTAAATGTNVIVSFVIRGASDADTTTFAAQVTAFIAGSTTPAFTATVAFGTANPGTVSAGGVGMDRATSTSTTETQSGGSGVANLSASMLVLFFAMIVALALRF